MENFVKQLRVRFYGLEDDGELNTARERKTQPSKSEKTKANKWFRRQFSGRRDHDGSSSAGNGEFESVIAASAFAVTSLEKEESLNQKRAPTEAPESAKGKILKPTVSFKEEPTSATPNNRDQKGKLTENHGTETKADAWEKAQVVKIEKRYEKLKGTILSWENEKQINARRRLERKERNLELKRARVQQEYSSEMTRINKIAGGARALAEERKRNDEVETKEKAKIIRTTGKIPVSCFCFCF